MNPIIHKIKGYLGYEVPLWINPEKETLKKATLDEWFDRYGLIGVIHDLKYTHIKLKLRPLESLTDDEIEYLEFKLPIYYEDARKGVIHHLKYHDYLDLPYEVIIYLHSIHIDYQDLIGQGLAVEKEEK